MLIPRLRGRLLALLAIGLSLGAALGLVVRPFAPAVSQPTPSIVPSPGSSSFENPNRWQWSRIELGHKPAEIGDLTTTTERVIAVGRSDGRAAAWFSPNGLSWTRAHIDVGRLRTDPYGDRAVLLEFAQVFESGDELLALAMPSYMHPIGYVSYDGGITWQQDRRFRWQDPRDLWWEGGWTMGDVVPGGPGFVSLGHGHAPGWGLFIRLDLMWLSEDGHVWKRVPSRRAPAWALDIDTLEVDGGVVYAVGDRMWQTTDGIRWHSESTPVAGRAGWVGALLIEDGRMVIGGARGASFDPDAPWPARGRIWSSHDGGEWTVELRQSRLSWVDSIDRFSFGIVATGIQNGVVMAYQRDAVGSWRPLRGIEHDMSYVSGAVEHDAMLILGGGLMYLDEDGFSQLDRAAIWVGVPPSS